MAHVFKADIFNMNTLPISTGISYNDTSMC